MKMQHRSLFALTLAVAFYGAPTWAAPLLAPNVHFMNATDLGVAKRPLNTNTTGVVMKRAHYGQSYIYGRSVNNQLGNIVIWNAGPSSNYGKSPPMRNMDFSRPQPKPPTAAPKLTYKPGYGKTTNTNDSQ